MYLKRNVQKFIERVTMIIVILFAMISDFEVNVPTVSFLLSLFGIVVMNMYLLEKYRRD